MLCDESWFMSHSDGKVIKRCYHSKHITNLINACLFNEKPLCASFQNESMKLDYEKKSNGLWESWIEGGVLLDFLFLGQKNSGTKNKSQF